MDLLTEPPTHAATLAVSSRSSKVWVLLAELLPTTQDLCLLVRNLTWVSQTHRRPHQELRDTNEHHCWVSVRIMKKARKKTRTITIMAARLMVCIKEKGRVIWKMVQR